MGYIGKRFGTHLICGTVVAFAAAPGTSAASLPAAGPTAATCDASARVDLRPGRPFAARLQSATCSGLVAGDVIQSSAGQLTGYVVRNGRCGWTIRDGRLRLWVTLFRVKGRVRDIGVSFGRAEVGTAAPLSGTATSGRDAFDYAGLVASVADARSLGISRPPCPLPQARVATVTFDLALTRWP